MRLREARDLDNALIAAGHDLKDIASNGSVSAIEAGMTRAENVSRTAPSNIREPMADVISMAAWVADTNEAMGGNRDV